MRSRLVALAVLLVFPAVAGAQGANARVAPGSPTADKLPIYEVDPTWPPTLPNDWTWATSAACSPTTTITCG